MPIKTVIRPSLVALAGGLIMFAATVSASAQSIERLAEADTNGDGNIGWQEMLDLRAATFQRLDRNGDGFADKNDSPRMGPGKKRFNEALTKIQNADANGDGRISKSEMINGPAPLFEVGDTDGDKVLSAEELSVLRAGAASQP